MPGLVVFRRRWSLGSDDLVVPAVLMAVVHILWLVTLSIGLGIVNFDSSLDCSLLLETYIIGYIIIMTACIISEALIGWISMKGTITNPEPRAFMPYLLYVRLVILIIEFGWITFGLVWLIQNYESCHDTMAKEAVLGATIFNWINMVATLLTIFGTFDFAGRTAYKLNQYQDNSDKRADTPSSHLHSSKLHRERLLAGVHRAKWNRRCQWWGCCVGLSTRKHRSSLDSVAQLVARYFENWDVVPTDLVAGLTLLRKQQKAKNKIIVDEGIDGVYQFLSGAAIYPNTRFLRLTNPLVLESYKKVVHFMKYSLGAYGWPMYMYGHAMTGCCSLFTKVKCCACVRDLKTEALLVGDNCCQCHYAALRKMTKKKKQDIIFVSFHNDVGEIPFYVAIDCEYKKVVVCVRGTLSMVDILTDLCADVEEIPVNSHKPDWLAHQGMVKAAMYIKDTLEQNNLLEKAFDKLDKDCTMASGLVVTGHSLGAGTAAILAILLQQEYPTLHCYAYSPPGGLLSLSAVQETKAFITSVVLGKDVIPRIGLPQMENFKKQVISAIKRCHLPKWQIIMGGLSSCFLNGNSVLDRNNSISDKSTSIRKSSTSCCVQLYPPGRIIHIVRNHPKNQRGCCSTSEPVYQAIWSDNQKFNEVLISSCMLTDHMPDNVMDALKKVLVNVGPAKPVRRLPESERLALLSESSDMTENHHDIKMPQIVIEHTLVEEGMSHDASHDTQKVSRQSSLSWDYTSPIEVAATATDDISKENLSHVRNQGQPLVASQVLNVSNESNESVPMASPESLSDTSSQRSVTFLGDHLHLANTSERLDPIEGSREGSPLKTVRVKSTDFPTDTSEEGEGDDSLLAQEIFAHLDKNPYCQSTPHTKPAHFTVAATIECDTPNTSYSHPDQHSNGPLDKDDDHDGDTFNMEEKSRLLYDKLKKSESTEMLKLTYECETSDTSHKEKSPVSRNLAETYNPQAPSQTETDNDNNHMTSQTETENDNNHVTSAYEEHEPLNNTYQQHYDQCQGTYSSGGRGYPHGTYNAPLS